MTAAREALARMHDEIRDSYSGDCLARARTLAGLLRAEGQTPRLMRLRRESDQGGIRRHDPLIPLRYRGRGGPAWTTHYVCCAGDFAYEPLIGRPIPLAGYATAVFGEEFEMELFEP